MTKIYLVHIEISKAGVKKNKQLKSLLKQNGFIQESRNGLHWRLVKELNTGRGMPNINEYLVSIFKQVEGVHFKITSEFKMGKR